jgi:hypothetical protein
MTYQQGETRKSVIFGRSILGQYVQRRVQDLCCGERHSGSYAAFLGWIIRDNDCAYLTLLRINSHWLLLRRFAKRFQWQKRKRHGNPQSFLLNGLLHFG